MARPKKVPTAATPAAAPKAAPAAATPAPKKVLKVTVYSLNTNTEEDAAEKKAVKPDSVGGVILEAVAKIEADKQFVTKAAILEEFRTSEKAGSLRAAQWMTKPQEYVNGYVDWLKGNRSLVSAKADAQPAS